MEVFKQNTEEVNTKWLFGKIEIIQYGANCSMFT